MSLAAFFKSPLEAVAPSAPPPPAAVIEYPATRGSKRVTQSGCPRELAQIVQDAWTVKRQIDLLETRLCSLNAQIEGAIEAGQAVVLEHTCRATRVVRQIVKIDKPDQVLAVLGEQRFSDLVDEKTTYIPTVKLKGMLEDDDELANALVGALSVSESTSIQYRAVA